MTWLTQNDFNRYLTLLDEVKKQETHPGKLRKLTLATIEEKYSPQEQLRIYTNGSLMANGRAGAGVHSTLFSYYIGVGENKTNFDGEIKVIHAGLQQLIYRPQAFNKAVILSESTVPYFSLSPAQPKVARLAGLSASPASGRYLPCWKFKFKRLHLFCKFTIWKLWNTRFLW